MNVVAERRLGKIAGNRREPGRGRIRCESLSDAQKKEKRKRPFHRKRVATPNGEELSDPGLPGFAPVTGLGVAAWFIGCLEVNAVVAEHIWLGNNLRDEMRNRKLGENAPTGAGPNNGLIVSERLDR
jgi:hypothetical protein